MTASSPAPSSSPHTRYVVYVDDNFHFMDEEERYKLGEFDTEEEALQACRRIVDEFLIANHKPGMTAEEFIDMYKTFGEDPWCAEIAFSAWAYAERRCHELCDKR